MSDHTNEAHPNEEVLPQRKKWTWSTFGGDGFLISLVLHVILALVAIFWVIKTFVTLPPEEPTTFATGAGGGTGGEKRNNFEHRITPKNARNLVKSPNRITVKGAATSVALPEMPNMATSAFESGALMGGSSKGLGGGAGGGEGTGIGVGKGGGRNFVSMFGASFRRPNMLEGTLYDTKRNAEGKPLFDFDDAKTRVAEMEKSIRGFVRNGSKKAWLDSKYATAPDKLFNTHVFIAPVDASSAMKPFGAEKEIHAPGWLLYYEGWITPPESDDYRLCGMGDDALLVLIDGKVVLWAPWSQGSMGTWFHSKDWMPENAYKPGGTLPNLGNGGRYFGSWVPMSRGRAYKLQVLLGDSYGGKASAEVMVQQKSKNNEKLPDVSVPLPIFKLTDLNEEEKKMKSHSHMKWTEEGPNFGCEINKVSTPRSLDR